MGFSERESRGRGSFRKKKALSAVMDADLDMLECSAEASPAAMEHATTEVNISLMTWHHFLWRLTLWKSLWNILNNVNIWRAGMREKLWEGSSSETFKGTFSQNNFKNHNKLFQIMHHGTFYYCDLIIWKSWQSVAISASIWMSCTQFLRLQPDSFGSGRFVTHLKACLY